MSHCRSLCGCPRLSGHSASHSPVEKIDNGQPRSGPPAQSMSALSPGAAPPVMSTTSSSATVAVSLAVASPTVVPAKEKEEKKKEVERIELKTWRGTSTGKVPVLLSLCERYQCQR